MERAGAEVTLTTDRVVAQEADGLLVPGVGAYASCMAGLREVRGHEVIGRRLAGGRPVLGICVGMQILFSRGVEHRSEEHTSELQSLMRISYADFCLQTKKHKQNSLSY